MFKVGLNKPPILFSKNPNSFKLTPIQQTKASEKKVQVVPKFFQKGAFRREA